VDERRDKAGGPQGLQRLAMAEPLPSRSLAEQIGVHRKKKAADRGRAVQEVAVRGFSCAVFLGRQDIDSAFSL
jgi:hypothetical protein